MILQMSIQLFCHNLEEQQAHRRGIETRHYFGYAHRDAVVECAMQRRARLENQPCLRIRLLSFGLI